MLSSKGVVDMSSRMRSISFSLGQISRRDKKSAAVLFWITSDCEIELDNVVKGVPQSWWSDFSLKKRVTDLLSVSMITGFGVPQKMCQNFLNAKNIAKNSFA